jgi:hypothetical protein
MTKRRDMTLAASIALIVMACNAPSQTGITVPITRINYQPSTENFANPERGFYLQKVGYDRVVHPDWQSFPLEELRQARAIGVSMSRVYFVIPDQRGQPLSQAFMDTFKTTLETARQAGIKIIPLFAYSFPTDANWYNGPIEKRADAPVDTILTHLENLRQTVRDNADVIAFWDAGFIGPWGEWHSSTNGLLGTTQRNDALNDKSRVILEKILSVVPDDRMITLRYPRHKFDLTGETPLTPQEAFSRTPKARLGAKNDCFLASNDDWGTYSPDDPASVERQKSFLSHDNLFLPQGGETCNSAADAQPYIGCENALRELERMRYTTLNIEFEQNVLNGWKKGGCYDEIARRLGYRFRLLEASLPQSVRPGGALEIRLKVINEGFGSLYNPRPLQVVLRAKQDGKRYLLATTEDPRRWLPAETREVVLSGGVPSNLPPSEYEVLLALPDASPRLSDRPEYALRFANASIWEAQTGLNALGHTITVSSSAPGALYTGSSWFK